ncbi:hypothetical protein LguiA_017696 [Lonicera macranthoides]
MRDVVNKLSSNSKKINPLVNLEFRARVVFNADSVLGTDSCTSMNSQVTKPGNIAEDSSIISAHEHVKTSHGSFIHPQGSKELVGSLETEWKTTNQYLLKEHAWLRCTRRCMFALVSQLNNLLRKLLQNLISNILSFGQCRNSIENTPTTDTGLLSNLHVFLLVHNSHPPPCRLNCMRQQKVESLDSTLRVKQLVNAVSEKVIRAGEFFNINILPVGNIYGFKVFSSKKFSLHICISDSEAAKMFDSARNLCFSASD